MVPKQRKMAILPKIKTSVKENRLLFPLILLGLVTWGLYFSTHFVGLEAPDAMENAALARNIAEGKGFVASSELPYRLAFNADYPFPELRRPPLQPLITSFFFRIFGVSDSAATLPSSLFYLLTISLIYVLSKEFFNKKVGLIANLIYIFHPEMLYYATSGLTEPLFWFLLTLSFYLLVKTPSPKSCLVLGLILGLAALTRDAGKFYFIGFLIFVFIYFKDQRFKDISALLIGFVIMMIPYWVRNFIILGNPFLDIKYMLLAAFSQLFPDFALEKSLMGTSPWPYLLSHPSVYLHKCLVGFNYFYHSLSYPRFNTYVLAFFFVSLFRQYSDKRIEWSKMLLISLIGLQIIISSLSVGRYRYLIPFFTLIFIFTAEFLTFLFQSNWIRNQVYKNILFLLLMIIFIYPFSYSIYRGVLDKSKLKTEAGFSYIKDIIQKNTKENGIIASDIPHVVAWYGNRTSIWLPYTIKMLQQINKEILPIEAVLLTSYGMKQKTESHEWEKVFSEKAQILDFNLVEEYQESQVKVLLYLKNKP